MNARANRAQLALRSRTHARAAVCCVKGSQVRRVLEPDQAMVAFVSSLTDQPLSSERNGGTENEIMPFARSGRRGRAPAQLVMMLMQCMSSRL